MSAPGPAALAALTVRQPYASLIIGRVPGLPGVRKDVENRTWRTGHRRIWIHSSVKRLATEPLPGGLQVPDVRDLPRGMLLGTVAITGIVTGADSIWAVPGQLHWMLDDPRPLAEPIPMTGRLFCWSSEQLAAIPPPD